VRALNKWAKELLRLRRRFSPALRAATLKLFQLDERQLFAPDEDEDDIGGGIGSGIGDGSGGGGGGDVVPNRLRLDTGVFNGSSGLRRSGSGKGIRSSSGKGDGGVRGLAFPEVARKLSSVLGSAVGVFLTTEDIGRQGGGTLDSKGALFGVGNEPAAPAASSTAWAVEVLDILIERGPRGLGLTLEPFAEGAESSAAGGTEGSAAEGSIDATGGSPRRWRLALHPVRPYPLDGCAHPADAATPTAILAGDELLAIDGAQVGAIMAHGGVADSGSDPDGSRSVAACVAVMRAGGPSFKLTVERRTERMTPLSSSYSSASLATAEAPPSSLKLHVSPMFSKACATRAETAVSSCAGVKHVTACLLESSLVAALDLGLDLGQGRTKGSELVAGLEASLVGSLAEEGFEAMPWAAFLAAAAREETVEPEGRPSELRDSVAERRAAEAAAAEAATAERAAALDAALLQASAVAVKAARAAAVAKAEAEVAKAAAVAQAVAEAEEAAKLKARQELEAASRVAREDAAAAFAEERAKLAAEAADAKAQLEALRVASAATEAAAQAAAAAAESARAKAEEQASFAAAEARAAKEAAAENVASAAAEAAEQVAVVRAAAEAAEAANAASAAAAEAARASAEAQSVLATEEAQAAREAASAATAAAAAEVASAAAEAAEAKLMGAEVARVAAERIDAAQVGGRKSTSLEYHWHVRFCTCTLPINWASWWWEYMCLGYFFKHTYIPREAGLSMRTKVMQS